MNKELLLLQVLSFKQTCMACGILPDLEYIISFCARILDKYDLPEEEIKSLLESIVVVENESYECVSNIIKESDKDSKKKLTKTLNKKSDKKTNKTNKIFTSSKIKIC